MVFCNSCSDLRNWQEVLRGTDASNDGHGKSTGVWDTDNRSEIAIMVPGGESIEGIVIDSVPLLDVRHLASLLSLSEDIETVVSMSVTGDLLKLLLVGSLDVLEVDEANLEMSRQGQGCKRYLHERGNESGGRRIDGVEPLGGEDILQALGLHDGSSSMVSMKLEGLRWLDPDGSAFHGCRVGTKKGAPVLRAHDERKSGLVSCLSGVSSVHAKRT